MKEQVKGIIASHAGKEGPLLPILHDVQCEFGYISEAAMRTIAEELNLTRAEVYGVISFYHDFKTEPETLPSIKVCAAEACQARGVRTLLKEIESDAANKVALEPVYCLGLCTSGPAAMTNKGKLQARLDADKLRTLIKEAQQ